MKKYPTFDELKQKREMRRKHEELQLFEFLLRNSEELNAHYHGRARDIADGLQPWIDALELSLRE